MIKVKDSGKGAIVGHSSQNLRNLTSAELFLSL